MGGDSMVVRKEREKKELRQQNLVMTSEIETQPSSLMPPETEI
jgi:hypothetical protein